MNEASLPRRLLQRIKAKGPVFMGALTVAGTLFTVAATIFAYQQLTLDRSDVPNVIACLRGMQFDESSSTGTVSGRLDIAVVNDSDHGITPRLAFVYVSSFTETNLDQSSAVEIVAPINRLISGHSTLNMIHEFSTALPSEYGPEWFTSRKVAATVLFWPGEDRREPDIFVCGPSSSDSLTFACLDDASVERQNGNTGNQYSDCLLATIFDTPFGAPTESTRAP